jgi:putative FmdB family regulatory protein
MPIYEFHCPSCDSDFEELVQSSGDSRKVVCPACGGKDVVRKLSVFSAHSAAAHTKCPLPSNSCEQCCGSHGACPL